jgi:hypothetical protein
MMIEMQAAKRPKKTKKKRHSRNSNAQREKPEPSVRVPSAAPSAAYACHTAEFFRRVGSGGFAVAALQLSGGTHSQLCSKKRSVTQPNGRQFTLCMGWGTGGGREKEKKKIK